MTPKVEIHLDVDYVGGCKQAHQPLLFSIFTLAKMCKLPVTIINVPGAETVEFKATHVDGVVSVIVQATADTFIQESGFQIALKGVKKND